MIQNGRVQAKTLGPEKQYHFVEPKFSPKNHLHQRLAVPRKAQKQLKMLRNGFPMPLILLKNTILSYFVGINHPFDRANTICMTSKAKCCRPSFVMKRLFPYKMWDSTKWYMYTYVNLVKTYLNEHISLYKMALGYLIIFLQYGRVLSKKIPVYNFEGSTR